MTAPLHRALAALLGLPDAAALPARIVAFAEVYPDDALMLARAEFRASDKRRLGVSRRDLRTPWMLAAVCGDPLARRALEAARIAEAYGRPMGRTIRTTAGSVSRHLREPVALPVASEVRDGQ